MSDSGLNANIYYLTSKYLGLINDFIIDLQENSDNLSNEKKAEIESLITKLQDEDIIDTRIQTLSIIIESQLRKRNLRASKYYQSLSEDLNNQKYESLAKNLNHVVDALDHEYSDALDKMKEA
jgi:hypothetical protein